MTFEKPCGVIQGFSVYPYYHKSVPHSNCAAGLLIGIVWWPLGIAAAIGVISSPYRVLSQACLTFKEAVTHPI